MKVVYLGEVRLWRHSCTDPAGKLIPGKVYTTEGDIIRHGVYSCYRLKEVDGEFNTTCFQRLLPSILAYAFEIPEVRIPITCRRLDNNVIVTIVPRMVCPIGVDTFWVEDGGDFIYIIQNHSPI